jgi:hypothetical protein
MPKVKQEIGCKHCPRKYEVELDPHDLVRWANGELIQNAMPYLTADERELIMTGTCGECWERLWKDVE